MVEALDSRIVEVVFVVAAFEVAAIEVEVVVEAEEEETSVMPNASL